MCARVCSKKEIERKEEGEMKDSEKESQKSVTQTVNSPASQQAISGTLRTARRHRVVAFQEDVEVLFQGTHDHVVITLLKADIPDSDETTCKN